MDVKEKFSKKFPEKTWLFVSLLLMGFLAGTLTYLFSPRYNMQATLMNTPMPKIFEKDGATYVAFPHPLIHVSIVSSADCTGVICDLNKGFYDFQRTISYAAEAQAFDKNSEKGKELIEKYKLSALPAFLVDKNVEFVPHFTEFKKFFENRGDRYLMITPVGELLNDFEIGENGEIIDLEEEDVSTDN